MYFLEYTTKRFNQNNTNHTGRINKQVMRNCNHGFKKSSKPQISQQKALALVSSFIVSDKSIAYFEENYGFVQPDSSVYNSPVKTEEEIFQKDVISATYPFHIKLSAENIFRKKSTNTYSCACNSHSHNQTLKPRVINKATDPIKVKIKHKNAKTSISQRYFTPTVADVATTPMVSTPNVNKEVSTSSLPQSRIVLPRGMFPSNNQYIYHPTRKVCYKHDNYRCSLNQSEKMLQIYVSKSNHHTSKRNTSTMFQRRNTCKKHDCISQLKALPNTSLLCTRNSPCTVDSNCKLDSKKVLRYCPDICPSQKFPDCEYEGPENNGEDNSRCQHCYSNSNPCRDDILPDNNYNSNAGERYNTIEEDNINPITNLRGQIRDSNCAESIVSDRTYQIKSNESTNNRVPSLYEQSKNAYNKKFIKNIQVPNSDIATNTDSSRKDLQEEKLISSSKNLPNNSIARSKSQSKHAQTCPIYDILKYKHKPGKKASVCPKHFNQHAPCTPHPIFILSEPISCKTCASGKEKLNKENDELKQNNERLDNNMQIFTEEKKDAMRSETSYVDKPCRDHKQKISSGKEKKRTARKMKQKQGSGSKIRDKSSSSGNNIHKYIQYKGQEEDYNYKCDKYSSPESEGTEAETMSKKSSKSDICKCTFGKIKESKHKLKENKSKVQLKSKKIGLKIKLKNLKYRSKKVKSNMYCGHCKYGENVSNDNQKLLRRTFLESRPINWSAITVVKENLYTNCIQQITEHYYPECKELSQIAESSTPNYSFIRHNRNKEGNIRNVDCVRFSPRRRINFNSTNIVRPRCILSSARDIDNYLLNSHGDFPS